MQCCVAMSVLHTGAVQQRGAHADSNVLAMGLPGALFAAEQGVIARQLLPCVGAAEVDVAQGVHFQVCERHAGHCGICAVCGLARGHTVVRVQLGVDHGQQVPAGHMALTAAAPC